MRRVVIALAFLTAGCATSSAAPETSPSTSDSSTTSMSTTTTPPPTSSSTTTTSSGATTSSTTTTTTLPDPEPTPVEFAISQQFLLRAADLMTGRAHGIEVAISRNGTVISEFALGNDRSGNPLADDALFRIASVSKVLTATVVLQLVQEGALDLDESLASAWGAPLVTVDPRVQQITVRQLLGHTSGLGLLRDTFFKNGVSDWHDAAAVAIGSVLEHDPGTFYHYSNANFVVLGALVERLTGQTLPQVVRDRVLTPLGITSARMATTTALTDPSGPSYLVDANRRYIEALGPAGAWEMSAGDAARVLAALQPDRPMPLLSNDSIRAMRTTNILVDDEPNWTYGLGLMVFPTWLGHTGTIEDARAFALALPNGYTVSVLCASTKVPSGEDLIEAFEPELLALAALTSTR